MVKVSSSQQHPHPQHNRGCLYIVATPIGNLEDISERAARILREVDLIAAEDTRHSRKLLEHLAIDTAMLSYHEHSEDGRVGEIIRRLGEGQQVALISDAGTPLISDPGYALVNQARELGLQVVPVPGACAVTTALSASGLPSDRFTFEGFLPAKAGSRLHALEALANEERTMIFYEAPHRVKGCLADMQQVFGRQRMAVLARELTKSFETIRGDTIEVLLEWVGQDLNQQRGEIVLLVKGRQQQKQQISAEATRTLGILMQDLPLKQAAALASKITGVAKNTLYQHGLEQKS